MGGETLLVADGDCAFSNFQPLVALLYVVYWLLVWMGYHVGIVGLTPHNHQTPL
jgi:hypothetical protein